MWLSGEGHSGRGISKGQDLEGRAWLARSRLSKEAGRSEWSEVGQSRWCVGRGRAGVRMLGFALSDAGAPEGP